MRYQVAALHGHPWTRRALDAISQSSSSSPLSSDPDAEEEEAEEAWVPPSSVTSSASDPSDFVKPPKAQEPAAFRVRLRVAGGRELVWDAGEIEGLELEGAHVVELGAC